MSAAYQHDCPGCVFVGTDRTYDGEPATNQVDLYVHVGPRHVSLIRRYGSEPANNASCSTETPISARYQPVLDAAQRMGLV